MNIPTAALKRTGVALLATLTIAGIGFGALAVKSAFGPASSDCDQMAADAADHPDAPHTSVTIGLSGNTDASITDTTAAVGDIVNEDVSHDTVMVVTISLLLGDRPIEPSGCIGRPVAIGPSSSLLASYEAADELRKGLLEEDMTSQREGRIEVLLAGLDEAIRNTDEPDSEPTAFGIWSAAATRLDTNDTAVIVDAFSPGGDNCMTITAPADLRNESAVAERVQKCVDAEQLPVIAAADIRLIPLSGPLNVTQASAQRFVMTALCSHATESPCRTTT